MSKALLGVIRTGTLGVVQQTFTFAGADQSLVVPADATSAKVYLWGAGGGNGTSSTGENPYAGGAGAMLQGILAVIPGETLTIVVGEGGGMLRRATYGGGGAAANNNSSGGGRSAIRRGGVDVVTAGAGEGEGKRDPITMKALRSAVQRPSQEQRITDTQ